MKLSIDLDISPQELKMLIDTGLLKGINLPINTPVQSQDPVSDKESVVEPVKGNGFESLDDI